MKIETEHCIYTFELGTEATLFYNRCRQECANNKHKDKPGIIVISGNEVTVPKWMPYRPMDVHVSKKETINL